MRLQLDVYGDEQLNRELLRFSAYVGNAQPAFKEIADDMREQVSDQFASEGQRGSGGWAALKPSTQASKAAAGLSPFILQATGDLVNSLTSQSHGSHIEDITDDSLTFGSKVSYGGFHQKGTSKMPARKPVEFTALDRRNFVRTLQRYFVLGDRS